MSATIESVLNHYSGDYATPDKLIPLLQEVQDAEGYLSATALNRIADHLKIAPGAVYGVATFYNQFRFKKPGEHMITVCRGTACHVRGSVRVLDAICQDLNVEPGDTTLDEKFSVSVVACIGACGLAPLITIDGEFFAGVTTDKVQAILNKYRSNENAEAGEDGDDK
jgi:NADH-quinone oxidoreductase subunit E